MMKIIFGFIIFCLVLFIYLHIQFHLKTSNDLEMYEVEQASKEKLEEICDIRQPVLFDFDNQQIMDFTNKNYIAQNYRAFEMKIRNVKDDDMNSEMYMPLPLSNSIKLFEQDKSSSYFTENNNDFLQETALIKHMRLNDGFLRPYMLSNCNYDIMMGSDGCCTPFRYELNYRNFFVLTQGSAQIKMSCPQNSRYLYTEYDYENFEFRSKVNPWNPQAKYSSDFDKMKCLEFALLPGKTLFIPAFWWYSIQAWTFTILQFIDGIIDFIKCDGGVEFVKDWTLRYFIENGKINRSVVVEDSLKVRAKYLHIFLAIGCNFAIFHFHCHFHFLLVMSF